MNTFSLHPWLKNPHLQTVGSVMVPRCRSRFPSKKRLFPLQDGSSLVAECSWQDQKTDKPTLIIVPGLNGSTISSYVRGTTAKAYANGFNVVRINLRNGGGSEKYSRTLFHAGQSDDLAAVVQELIMSDGLEQIGLIGFSFGGNICLKAVAEWGVGVPQGIFGVVGISPLIDLGSAVNLIDNNAPAVYRWQLLRGLKSSIRVRSRLYPGQHDPRLLGHIKTLRQYDDAYAPYNGFQSTDDYYAKASVLPLIAQIKVPTLLLEADDDPVIPPQSFRPIDNPLVQVIITRGGGHGGFIAQTRGFDPDLHWAENRAVEFLQARL